MRPLHSKLESVHVGYKTRVCFLARAAANLEMSRLHGATVHG